MATNSKWFFPAQAKINNYLAEKYGDNVRCDFQDVCENFVYETYSHWDKQALSENNNNPAQVTFIIHRNNGREQAPGLITVLHSKYEDIMQYFKQH